MPDLQLTAREVMKIETAAVIIVCGIIGCRNQSSEPAAEEVISITSALTGDFVYVRAVSESSLCAETHSNSIEWVMVERIDGYYGGEQNPVVVFGGSGDAVGILDTPGVPSAPLTLKSAFADEQSLGECAQGADLLPLAYGGWIISFRYNDEYACAASISELQETVFSDRTIDDVCAPEIRRMPLSEWTSKTEKS